MDAFNPLEEDDNIDPVTGEPYVPNMARDPDDPREKMKTYLATRMASDKKMATPEFRQANRAPMDALQDSNRDLAMGKLLMQSANQMGTMGGKAASSAPINEFSDQMIGMNQAAGQNILRDRQEATQADDRQGKMMQYLADRYQSSEDKAKNLKMQQDALAEKKRYNDAMLGLKTKEVATASDKAAGSMEGIKKLDREFAVDYNDWTSTGRSTVEKNVQMLQQAKQELASMKNDTISPTGRVQGLLPDALKPEKTLKIMQKVHESTQAGLKAALGSQFTAKEGDSYLQRSFDPKLSEDENIAKIDREIERIKGYSTQTEKKSRFFETNKTLNGWSDERGEMNFDAPPTAAPGAAARPGSKPVMEMSNEELLRELGE